MSRPQQETLHFWINAAIRMHSTGIDEDGPWEPGTRVYRETLEYTHRRIGDAYMMTVYGLPKT